MIYVNKVSKYYGSRVVLEDFSYTFQDAGFYLLFGESGSGKTTLLNIIAGLTSFDSGEIKFDTATYSRQAAPSPDIEYLTQDCTFINFLNMYENLQLVSDDKQIQSLVKLFGVSELLNSFPLNLSGGERQRFAGIRALLNKKKILLLDEPTASLDEENTRKVFSQLSQMKKDVLIICTSHDPIAKEYADETLEISKSHTPRTPEQETAQKSDAPVQYSTPVQHQGSVYPFLKKWMHSPYRSKKTDYLFTIFMTVAVLICCLVTPPAVRMDATMKNLYQINAVKLVADADREIQDVTDLSHVGEIIFPYLENVPIEEQDHPANTIMPAIPYETEVFVLPESEKLCRLSEKIAYGSYFTDTDQIILTKETAEKLMSKNPEKLIGKTLRKTFYGIGEKELKIVGIFEELNDFDRAYLNSLGGYHQLGSAFQAEDLSSTYFVNSRFTAQFESNPDFHSSEKRTYYLMFPSFREAKNFCRQNEEKQQSEGFTIQMTGAPLPLQHIAEMLFFVMVPFGIAITLFTAIFYCNNIYVETSYQSSFLSVFEYMGYSVKKVRREFLWIHFLRLCFLLGISIACALVISLLTNLLNQSFIFIPFQLICLYPPFLLTFGGFLLAAGYLILRHYIHKVRYKNWYQILTENRDLL